MEFLKDLFPEGKALTYEELSKAARDKGFEVVNAAGGAYVPKASVETLTGQLNEANNKLKGYDPDWEKKMTADREKLERERMDFAIEQGIRSSKARNVKAVQALIDRDKLKYAGGEVIGLDKQLQDLRKGQDTAFLFEAEAAPKKTGLSHQGGSAGAEKKDSANAALRALFGR